MSAEFNFTDNQWYNFICGFHAGLKLKDLTLPPFENNIVLHPIGVGGWGMIGIAMPRIQYIEDRDSYSIPIFTHDVDLDYSGFSVNIGINESRLIFEGVTEGDFGTIGDTTSSADIRYSYSNGTFKARGIRDNTVKFKEEVILFFIDVTVIDKPTKGNPIKIPFRNSSYTDMNYTTLLKWVEVAPGSWYNFFITPVLNVDGQLTVDIEDNEEELGDETTIAAPGTPSGVYIGSAYTPPGERGVVPIVACSNKKDNFPYNGVHCTLVVEDNSIIFTYLDVVAAGTFNVTTNKTVLPSGHIQLDIVATRSELLQDAVTFCYIDYIIENKESGYVIPLRNMISELTN